MGFSKEQNIAITHGTGPMLVLAGPGSGKTLVIVQRVRCLTEQYGVKPEQILVITFTKAAAEEMKQRFDMVDRTGYGRVSFGTFHAAFFYILKESYGYTDADILRETEKYRILRDILYRLVPDRICEQEELASLISRISCYKTTQFSECKALQSKGPGGTEEPKAWKPEETDYFQQICDEYEKTLRRQRRLDFDDMLILCYRNLKRDLKTLEYWQERYRYILVDEFQDSNRLQYEIVRLLASKNRNLFVVGDDDQSIYAFRGATPGLMEQLRKDFPEVKECLLGCNYRSAAIITRTAGKLILCNKNRIFKELTTANGKQGVIRTAVFHDRSLEYTGIINQLCADGRIPLSEQVILYRTNSQARLLTECLAKQNVPFCIRGTVPDIYEHRVAKDILTYLRIAAGDRNRSLYLRICNRPDRYISREVFFEEQVEQEAVLRYATERQKYGIPSDERQGYGMPSDERQGYGMPPDERQGYGMPSDERQGYGLPSEERQRYGMSSEVNRQGQLDQLRHLFWHLHLLSGLNPYAGIQYIRKAIGYEQYLRKEAEAKGMPPEDLIEVLEELSESAREFSAFSEWLEQIEQRKENRHTLKKSRNSEGAALGGELSLMTFHASKGLEFSRVWLIDLNDGIVPHRRAMTEGELEEERRLLYVAMTRAKEELYLYYAEECGGRKLASSRFLKEMKLN